MFKKLVILIGLLAIVAFGLQIYAKQSPTSRVAFVVKRFRDNLPGLLGDGQLSSQSVTEFGKQVLKQSERDEAKQNGKVVIYKWRDADGNWSYGGSPPPGVSAVSQELDLSKTNKLKQ